MARRTGGRIEKDEVADTLDYLKLIFRLGTKFFFWINEEHPGPKNRSHPARKRASDILMIIPTKITPEMVGTVIGRFGAIEMKKAKDYKFIMANYDRLRDDQHNNDLYDHYQDQIKFIDMINNNGGLAFFAACWQHVRDKLKESGVDKTNVIIAGDNNGQTKE